MNIYQKMKLAAKSSILAAVAISITACTGSEKNTIMEAGSASKFITTGIPNDRLYTETHEWIKIIDETVVRIGITPYALDGLDNATIIYEPVYTGNSTPQYPSDKYKRKKNDTTAKITCIDGIVYVLLPTDGLWETHNTNLDSNPYALVDDLYESGWTGQLYEIEENQYNQLMTSVEYQDYIESLGL